MVHVAVVSVLVDATARFASANWMSRTAADFFGGFDVGETLGWVSTVRSDTHSAPPEVPEDKRKNRERTRDAGGVGGGEGTSQPTVTRGGGKSVVSAPTDMVGGGGRRPEQSGWRNDASP